MGGSRGPVPKRSQERAGHRAKADQPDQVTAADPVKVPPASSSWAPAARRWYRSLKESGQSKFFEPSDWEFARILAELLTDELGYVTPKRVAELAAAGKEPSAKRRSSEMVKAILASMDNLGTTEGARRRMRIEVLRPNGPDLDDDAKIAVMDQYRRLGAAEEGG